MEGPIQGVPIEHVVPRARPNLDRRKQGDARKERDFALPGETSAPEPAPPENEHNPPIHEDGVGENLDVTA